LKTDDTTADSGAKFVTGLDKEGLAGLADVMTE